MEFEGDGLDAVLIELYQALLATEGRNEGGSRGPSKELLGITLRIFDPRSRLSRSEDRGKPYSALGELLWYLSGSDRLDFIEPYVPRYRGDAVDGVLPGAYGPRLFAKEGNIDQVANVSNLLRRNPGTRRAVIQLFDARDIVTNKTEVPCTTTLQFHLRGGLLHLSVGMRSNDAYFGLPHDVFCFSMIQEMMARRLAVEVGTYIHHAGSMHVYDKYVDSLRSYTDEGHHRPNVMPPMPSGDPFNIVPFLLKAEDTIRRGEPVVAANLFEDVYWADVIRLFQVFWASGQGERLDELKRELVHPMYKPFVESRRHMKVRVPTTRAPGTSAA